MIDHEETVRIIYKYIEDNLVSDESFDRFEIIRTEFIKNRYAYVMMIDNKEDVLYKILYDYELKRIAVDYSSFRGLDGRCKYFNLYI